MKKFGLILAGGQSKRLFPLEEPKPLLKVGGKSLLQQAIEKLKDFEVRIIANAQIANRIQKAFEADGLQAPKCLVEPEGRDTAAAVGFGLREIAHENPDWVAVLSADQWMKDGDQFADFLKGVEREVTQFPTALFVAGSDQKTKRPETYSSFGWIVPGKKERAHLSSPVSLFVEKPKGAKLKSVRSKKGLINAGMFFGNYKTFLSAYETLYPQVLDRSYPYASLERKPVDKAIFEKFENVRVLALRLRWEDLGTWEDWQRHIKAGPGPGGTLVDSKNVFISAEAGYEIYSFGNQDLAIVQSGKKILVMPLSQSKDLKEYLSRI